ncbi:hypothetical protein [Mycolicibacterium fortuitum]|uniref:hypothetical protein n=1 Tax=Mycolicibacterium fortuitum TaxID=1766 RepID=UPI0007E9E2CF|nr:hypothetical protein [Mycolicibacterium fortuitum]OBF77102.1 hypothetical protein A5751_23280 [Mycolicibacterium fortuitum]
MPRQVDTNTARFGLSHDPTSQLTPDVGLQKQVNALAEIFKGLDEKVRAEILRVIETLLGIAANPIPALQDWVEGLPAQAAAAVQALKDQLTKIVNATDTDIDNWLLGLLTGESPLDAAKLFGQFRTALLGPLPIGLFTDEQLTMLFEGGFDDPVTIIAGPGIEHDATDGAPGTAPLGCAKVACDGTGKQRATPVMKVSPGWVLKLGGRIKYQGLTAGANAIRLNLIPYSNESTPIVGGTVMVATPGNVSGTSGGTGGWGTGPFEGSWTVPATGVTHVAVEWEVTNSATAGVVKFDELYLQATQKIPQAFTKDLPEDLQALVNEALSLWQGLGERLHVDEWDDWLADTWTNAQAEANQIRDILAGLVVTPINSAVQAIKDWWAGVVGKTQHLTSGGTLPPTAVDSAAGGTSLGQDLLDTWNKIVGGYRRTAATGQTSADVEEVMMSVGQEILVAQESTITLANQANAPRNVPFWVSPNRFEEVSFPRALLQPVPSIGSGGSGTTGTGSGLTVLDANWNAEERDAVRNHTHSTPSHSHALSYVKPTFTIPDGTLALTAITMTQDRLINVARFLAGGGTPPSTALYVGLYAIDPVTGTQTLVYDYGDQKGNINTGADLYETALNLPADMLADAGAMFAVGILPVGGSFAVAGVRRQPIVTAAVIYPVAATELVSGQSSLPATVDNSSMNHSATHRIWVSLGQAVESIPEDTSPVTLTMTFNVADTSAWSSPSFQQYGNADSNFTVKSGSIYGGGPTVLFGDVTYWRSGLCLTPVHTNDHMAEITLGTGFDNDAYGYATDRAYVRCNSSGTSGVCLHVDATGGAVRVRIATITNLTSIGTVRVTATGIPYAVGDRFSIRAVGNVYTAYRNDAPILDGNGDPVAWTDSGNIVPIGKAWRRTAFGSGSRATNGFNHYEPAHIDAFKAADLAG